jgi:predicted nucleic acid-binding protein
LGLLNVLGKLFDQVFVPPAVQQELILPRTRFDIVELSQYAFIEVRAPQDGARVQRFLQVLDAGESEALALALEVHAEALLVDETDGRDVAIGSGMPVIGTLGILSRAKARGHIATIGPLLDRLRYELDFYLSDELCKEFLRSIGE